MRAIALCRFCKTALSVVIAFRKGLSGAVFC